VRQVEDAYAVERPPCLCRGFVHEHAFSRLAIAWGRPRAFSGSAPGEPAANVYDPVGHGKAGTYFARWPARDLLEAFADLADAVLTIDAMHTQHDTAQVILGRGADYVMTVKANTPTLYQQLKKLPWSRIPAVSSVSTGASRTSSTGSATSPTRKTNPWSGRERPPR
jgi:hypothetical protein